MSNLWIEICNERLVSRFGVDRILLLAAREFKKRGARVTFSCLRFDPDLLEAVSSRTTTVQVTQGHNMRQVEKSATLATMQAWTNGRPDVIVCGGWPFFDLAARSPSLGVPSVFIDAGAVPHDGLAHGALDMQLELRRIRSSTLPFISRVLPISEFIRSSQTLHDRCSPKGVRTVLLGSDHLTDPQRNSQVERAPGGLVSELHVLKQNGLKLILVLGRYELNNYKNSNIALEVFKRVRLDIRGCRLLFLAERRDLQLGQYSDDGILALGHPSDDELVSIMKLVDVGISVSHWEGFNLPVVEMQHLGRPALAFSLAAHPEVIADPWFLCATQEEMTAKVSTILAASGAPVVPLANLARFHTRLPWRDCLDSWYHEIRNAALDAAATRAEVQGRRMVLIDVTNSARDPANSGVVRVTRQLGVRLAYDATLDVVFIKWNFAARAYELTRPNDGFLGAFGGPKDYLGMLNSSVDPRQALELVISASHPHCAEPPILLFAEVALSEDIEERMTWAKRHGFPACFILYDLIPIYYSKFCSENVASNFPFYLRRLLHSEYVISISRSSLVDLYKYSEEQKLLAPAAEVVWLPAQFGQAVRLAPRRPDSDTEIRILCVSTLEPRKNHMRLVEAFELLVSANPVQGFKLTLVGNRYAGGDAIVDSLRTASERGLPIEWRGVMSEADLAEQYRKAHFTVYPSMVEGFGLPILESLWFGKPNICANNGNMAELARDGGCVQVDVEDSQSIFEAMQRLSFDVEHYRSLCKEIAGRTLDSWDDYASRISAALKSIGSVDADMRRSLTSSTDLEAGRGRDPYAGWLSALLDSSNSFGRTTSSERKSDRTAQASLGAVRSDEIATPDRPLIFLHVPKCGGISVGSAVTNAIEASAILGGMDRKLLGKFDDFASIAEDLKNELHLDGLPAGYFDFVGGHHSLSTLTERFPEGRYFTVVREPHIRLLSHFLYWRSQTDHHLDDWGTWKSFVLSARGPLSEFLRNPTIACQTDNLLTRLLLQPDRLIPEDGFIARSSFKELAQRAIAKLEDFEFVDFLENRSLKANMRDWLRREVTLTRENETDLRADLSLELVQELDPETIALLQQRSAIDLAVWVHVCISRLGCIPVDLAPRLLTGRYVERQAAKWAPRPTRQEEDVVA